MSNASQYRLHPVSILFNLIKTVREGIFLIVFGFITFDRFYFILLLAVFLLLGTLLSVLSWYRFTYRLEAGELRIEYGVFIRKKRYISTNRIQSIDLTAGVIHRMFKLVKLQIETAGSGKGAEASLNAVKISDGEKLRKALKGKKVSHPDVEIEVQKESVNPSREITPRRLLLTGVTSGSAGIIMAFVAFAFSELEQFIPSHFYDWTFHWISELTIVIIIGLAIVVLFIFWLLGIAGTMIKYGKFTITKIDDELFIARGLLEKKQLTIPLKRIQAVGIKESIIRQPFGFVTVFVEVAGGSLDSGEDFSTVLFPIMKKTEVDPFLQEFLPNYVQESARLTALPKRAMKFYLIRTCIPVLLLGLAVIYFFPQFSWLVIFALFVAFLLGFMRYKDGGFSVEPERIVIRFRGFSKKTMFLHHKRIQAFEKKQNPFQKRELLATVKLSILGKSGTGKHYRLKELEEAHANRLSDWYSYRE